MAKIKQLSPLVADLIAAGEVVERPASVVKELIENSIDAGSTQITVEIKNGGMSYIRVTDNGCGMSEEDAKTAFLRHATSKLRTARDLEAIGTLGFRGEALAAISAVSNVELITKEPGAQAGTRVLAGGGSVLSSEPAGCPDGTTFIVRDLFFNTPARLKFIKNDRAEGSAVSSVVIRCALSHPEVSIKYIREGKEECHTAGDGRVDSCIYSVFGRDFASGLLKVSGGDEKIGVEGYISSPSAVRGNRSRQFFFVNGRFIRSKTLQAALERAYSNSLFTGKYPSCVLYITIGYGSVDVNVHPTKTEVKFSDENAVFSAVYSAALSALGSENRTSLSADIELSQSTKNVLSDNNLSGEYGSAKPYGRSGGSASNYGYKAPSGKAYSPYTSGEKSPFDLSPRSGGGRSFVFPETEKNQAVSDFLTSRADVYQTSFHLPAERSFEGGAVSSADRSGENTGGDFEIIGECLNTYIIVQKDGNMILIDKHAAHERIIFDRLMQSHTEDMSQFLLESVVCDMSPEEMEILAENEEVLSQLGFEIDQFGDRAVAVRRLPADIDTGEVKSMLDEICEKLSVGGQTNVVSRREEILHSVACKAAIKAGRRSHPDELYGLVSDVISGKVKYCPHGRPVSVTFTKRDLDRQFRRA